MIVAETPRLILRHLTLYDADDLATIYADTVVMNFYPSTQTYEETKQRVEQIINCYDKNGFGLWATIYKADNKFIGRCGLSLHGWTARS
ncbi:MULTISPECIES: GNAT family N-acetyltransferase [Cyanophyceae]|uniref:GNAT family N-acetyltransferase n=1 Tax=Cyanophyceae TaxID=3028117 RepID=UPI0018EF4F0D